MNVCKALRRYISFYQGRIKRNQAYCDYCGPILLLKFSEPASVNYTRYYISHVKGLTDISADDTVQLRSWIKWVFRLLCRLVESPTQLIASCERMISLLT